MKFGVLPLYHRRTKRRFPWLSTMMQMKQSLGVKVISYLLDEEEALAHDLIDFLCLIRTAIASKLAG